MIFVSFYLQCKYNLMYLLRLLNISVLNGNPNIAGRIVVKSTYLELVTFRLTSYRITEQVA